jgi:hypothetical protein
MTSAIKNCVRTEVYFITIDAEANSGNSLCNKDINKKRRNPSHFPNIPWILTYRDKDRLNKMLLLLRICVERKWFHSLRFEKRLKVFKHELGRKIFALPKNEATNPSCCLLVSCLAYFLSLKMEAVRSSEKVGEHLPDYTAPHLK